MFVRKHLAGKWILRADFENKKGKGIVRAGSGRHSLNSSTSYRNKKGQGIVTAGYGNKMDF